MSQPSPSQCIKLPKCMNSLNDEEKYFLGRTISPVVNDFSSSISDSMHPITLCNSFLHNTNGKDELFLNSEDHSMGRTISPAVNDSPLSKNDSSLNKKSNHSHRRFQIAQKLLTQILDHASRSRAQNCPHIKSNSDLIDGHMKGVGFCCGSDSGKSLGVYARKTTMNPEVLDADNEEWMTLSWFENFVSSCIKILSMSAAHENNDIMQEAQLPEWHEGEWNPMFHQKLRSFSNVIITTNGFHNHVHRDEKDMNTWTYGLFTFFDKSAIKPIPCPIRSCGYGLSFPEYSTLLDSSSKQGIIELLWKTSTTFHQTTQPPPIFDELPTITHFGCSFQINSMLYSRVKSPICMDPITQEERTYGCQERIKMKRKDINRKK
ncbi:hypothetical protein O181_119709 [Austropuccinia psidii MF-1]|uniref:Tet-like 2OG-Fe(II) oxygenase domain-containing protein n=1 Tax=Austropuccinia psidii MF-1 TaxID=1389203 RepID=A0A9Q3PZQ5_9BASI|nr:hypothetical protein [Austropuccinia psidii MF-1]